MMEHEKCIELISELVDGELDEKAAAEVRGHIASCPECRRVYEVFSGISEGLSELEEPPEELHGSIMSGIRRSRKKKSRIVWIKALSAAACLAIVVFAGIRAGMSPATEQSGQEDALLATYDNTAHDNTAQSAQKIDISDDQTAEQLERLLQPAGDDSLPAADEPDRVISVADGDGFTDVALYFEGEEAYADYGAGPFRVIGSAGEILALIN